MTSQLTRAADEELGSSKSVQMTLLSLAQQRPLKWSIWEGENIKLDAQKVGETDLLVIVDPVVDDWEEPAGSLESVGTAGLQV